MSTISRKTGKTKHKLGIKGPPKKYLWKTRPVTIIGLFAVGFNLSGLDWGPTGVKARKNLLVLLEAFVDTSSIWQAVLGELEVNLSRANFTTWFKNTGLASVDDGVAVISVPNIFTKEWLENKYHKQIAEALRKNVPDLKNITYQVGAKKKAEAVVTHTDVPTEGIGGEIEETPEYNGNLNPNYTFATFVTGDSSRLAFAAAQSVAKKPGTVYNPLFIYGGVGLGKTHLMQAVAHEILKANPKKKIEYVSSEKFTSDFVASLSKNSSDFKDKYRSVDVLLVDDVQFLAGKEQTQVEFFHTFNALHQSGKQVVIASDRPPKSIPTLEERLRSRFEWGLIVDIQPPDLETRIAILQRKAQSKGIDIPLEVLDYIARQVPHNVRELEGALNRVIAYCELNNTKCDLSTITGILGGLLSGTKRRGFTAKQIMEKTADFYDIGYDEITGPKRDKEIVLPRQIAMYLMREELHLSYPKIAAEIGKKDHTTVMHGVEKIEKELDANEQLRQEINLVRERLFMK